MGAESFLTLQIADFAEGVDDRVAALLQAGTGITLTYNDGAGTLTIANTGLGGSTGATDNRILRADGTGGSTVQNSAVTIDDSGNISGLGTVGCGAITASGAVTVASFGSDPVVIRVGSEGDSAPSVNAFLGGYSANAGNVSTIYYGQNLYYNGSNWIHPYVAGRSSLFYQQNGAFYWNTHAGNAATGVGTERMSLNNSGTLAVDGTVSATSVRCQGGSGIVGTRYINNSNDTWSAFEFPANVSAATFSPSAGGGLFRFEGTTSAHVAWKRSSQTIQARLADDSGFASISCRDMVASGLVSVGTYTVATLPSAAANVGALAQVTDSSVTTNGSAVSGSGSNRVVVFSNGSTWDVVVA